MWLAASAIGHSLPGDNSVVGEMDAHGPELPRAVAYLRKHLLMNESEVLYAKERLAYFARVEGLQLDNVFVEEVETWPAAFEALVEAALSDELSVVLLPSMLHFAVLGAPLAVKLSVESAIGARVLIATPPDARS